MRISSVLCVFVLVGALCLAHGMDNSKRAKLRARLKNKMGSDPAVDADGSFNKGSDEQDAGEAWFPLKSTNTFQCATVHFNHKKQLNEVVQKPCEGFGADGQMWVVRSDRQVENKELAGNCMTVLKGRKAAGNKIVLRPCDDGGYQWSRLVFTPLSRGNHAISFLAKNWTYYCLGTNDFDHNIRIYGCDANHPYQMWKFDANQYVKIPRCNAGDYPEEQVRCGDNVYLYQANKNSVSWVRMPPGDDQTIATFTKLEERKPWKVECTLQKEGDRMYENAGLCFKQNRRYLTLDNGLHWTQEKHCNLDLPDSWQNMRITNMDTEAMDAQEEVNKGAVYYACRDQSDVLHNYVSLTGEYYGTNHDPTPVWMRIGADQRVSTSVAKSHEETRIFLLPPGW